MASTHSLRKLPTAQPAFGGLKFAALPDKSGQAVFHGFFSGLRQTGTPQVIAKSVGRNDKNREMMKTKVKLHEQ